VPFDDFHNKGYALDANRFATYEYEVKGLQVSDKISNPQAAGLTREITVTNAPANLYCRVAAAGIIEDLGKGLYAIGDHAYYVQVATGAKAAIRQMPNGKELLLPVAAGSSATTYSIIW